MSSLLRAAVAVLVVLAMSESGSRSSPASWFSFAAYPQARRLCQEHIMGHNGPKRMEIEWMSYATADAPEKVVAFYENDQKTKAKPDRRGGYDVDAAGNERDKMSIIPAGKAKHYPSCSTHAASHEKTVIIVSRATGG